MKLDNTINSLTISEYLDSKYLEYGMYTLEERAIPSVIDGFKPTQRKIIYVADKIWKSGSEKPLKVFQLGGKIASDANYHHGDASVNGAIIGMAQKFKNTLPVLDSLGQYGSLRSPSAGAPRYISTKTTKNFRLLYKDFELLENKIDEGVVIEPKYFLPIIPTVLLNGSSGIAVGFSTNILNRNPLDLIIACQRVLDGKKPNVLLPYWTEFTGNVSVGENPNQYIMTGTYSIINTTTVKITELPPYTTYKKYESHLDSLIEKGIVVSYENNSSKSVNYTLRFTRSTLSELINKGTLEKILKLSETDTEILTCLDEFGKLILFDSVDDIVKYFVNFRLTYYYKRKEYLVKSKTETMDLANNRAKFIKLILDNKIKVFNRKLNEIILDLEKYKLPMKDESYSYLLNMPIQSLTFELYNKLLNEILTLQKEIEIIQNTEPIDMYKSDLIELKNNLKKSS